MTDVKPLVPKILFDAALNALVNALVREGDPERGGACVFGGGGKAV